MNQRLIIRRRPDELVAEVGGQTLAVLNIADGRILAEPVDRSSDAVGRLRRRRADLLA